MRHTTLSVCLLALSAQASLGAPPESVTLTIDPVAHNKPYTGRLYVCFVPGESPDDGAVIGAMHDWFNPAPLASWDVAGVTPGEPISLDLSDALFHMHERYEAAWGSGVWTARAVARLSPDSPKAGTGAGDLLSDPVTIDMDAQTGASFTLDTVVAPRAFPETETDKHFALRSQRLSEFHGRDVMLHAGVRLPEGYHDTLRADPYATFPVVYIVTGFGGTHRELARYAGFYTRGIEDTTGAIIVVPDATNYWGHSVFANSEVTGPWGDALVHELIPAIEAVYRGAGPEHRYVTGVSSGGWSSLWLQLEYPGAFAGCWSHAPDPVDFRAFQTPDIYDPATNYYDTADGEPRPIARRTDPNGNDNVMLTSRAFIARETVLGPGGQIESFEAVFSPANPDGTPQQLFDRETGAISSETASTWEPYDITKKMLKEAGTKGPALAGKVRVYGGEIDNFYLGESVALLRDALLEAGVDLASFDDATTPTADADVRVIPGMTHTLYQEGNAAMWATIREHWSQRHISR